MKYKSTTTTLLVIVLLLAAPSCNDDGPDDTCNADFDQTAMLQNVADNLILPAYQQLLNNTTQLQTQTNTFLADPNQTSLNNLRSIFETTWLQWQHASPYEFGPAQTAFLRNTLNNFPLDTVALKDNINLSTNSFNNPDTYDKGFPALDYLLYGLAPNDAEIIAQFNTANDAELYRSYLLADVANMQSLAANTYEQWNSSYQAEFVGNTGTAAGTSLSNIINGLNQNYESIKRDKIGIPSGVLTSGFANPQNTEAYYSGLSLKLAQAALQASQTLYLGANSLGLDDYLIAVDAQKGNGLLNDAIKAQFTNALNALQNIEAPLSNAVETDNANVITAYNEITKQLVDLKTSMPSVLCVSITYIDNPSDSD